MLMNTEILDKDIILLIDGEQGKFNNFHSSSEK